MKRILHLILALAVVGALSVHAVAAPRPNSQRGIYFVQAQTGGTAGALDSLDITGDGNTDITDGTPNQYDLIDGDCAILGTDSSDPDFRFYVFDADATDSESVPDVIRPDSFSTAGVWRAYQLNLGGSGVTGLLPQSMIAGFGPSATPGFTLDDTDGADAFMSANAADADDAVAIIGVDDSQGDDQPYVEFDGANERVEFKRLVQFEQGVALPAASVGFNQLAASAKFQSLQVSDLADTTSPHVLTVEETTNKVISNYAATGADREFEFPAPHANGNVIFQIGDEFQTDVVPPTGTAAYLNGTVASIDEHIINASDTLLQRMVCYCPVVNGAYVWACYSGDSGWAEAN